MNSARIMTIARWAVVGLLIVAVYLARRVGVTQFPEEAEAGRELCEPVIDALEAYEAENQSYPSSLEELVPDYLTEIPDGKSIHPDFQGVFYIPSNATYRLNFLTQMWGADCTYSPEDGWYCADQRD
jgi:hypothetical protein